MLDRFRSAIVRWVGKAPTGSAAASEPPSGLAHGRDLAIPPPPPVDDPQASTINLLRGAPGGWYIGSDGKRRKQAEIELVLEGGATARVLVTAIYSYAGIPYELHFEPVRKLSGTFVAHDIRQRQPSFDDIPRPGR